MQVLKSMHHILPCLLILSLFACQNAEPKIEGQGEAAGLEKKMSSKTTKNKLAHKKTYLLPEWPLKAKTAKGKAYPFDEGPNDPGFVEFRQRLYQALKEKDASFLQSILAEDIRWNFGDEDDNGKASFIKDWALDTAPDESRIWKALALCLELGGKWDAIGANKRFVAPYVFSLDFISDPFQEGVIIGDNVRLRDAPGTDSNIIGGLSWDHYSVLETSDTQEEIGGESHYWVKLKTMKGEEGYVYGKYTRSPIDFRAFFAKNAAGKWLLTLFIAGD